MGDPAESLEARTFPNEPRLEPLPPHPELKFSVR